MYRVDAKTVETMIAAMESRIQEKYDNMMQELRERVSKADSEKNRLEHKLREMQNLLAKTCEQLKLEPPATYEEFCNGHAAVEGQEISNNFQEPVVGSMVNGFDNVTTSSTLSQPEQDAVDSAPAKSFGVQKVIFRCEKEPEGTQLDEGRVRMFTGKYGFSVRGQDVQARIVFVRLSPKGPDGPCPVVVSICFPEKTSSDSKTFYDPMVIRFAFMDSEGNKILSKEFPVEPENGFCQLASATDKEHWVCENGTYWDEDFLEFGKTEDQAKLEQHGILIKKFPNEKKQAFYLKADVEFLLAPSKLSVSAIEPAPQLVPAAPQVTPAAAPQVVSGAAPQAVPKKIDLTPELMAAFGAWQKNPRIRHSWYSNAGINLDLIEYALQENKRDLVTQCTQNLVKIPRKAPHVTMPQINRMWEIGEKHDIIALMP